MNRRNAVVCCVALVIALFCLWSRQELPLEEKVEESASDQTKFATAEISFEQGVPNYHIQGIGKVVHPSGTAIYALAYMGKREVGVPASEEYAANCIRWLKEHIEDAGNGMKGWSYSFDNTYNDVSIKAPWYSAFGQALGIEALLCWHEKTGDAEALKLAREAAEMLFVPIKDGGQLFMSGEDIWFEEIPTKDREPSHILNGHMSVLIALRHLYDATGDEKFLSWYRRGTASLIHWLPLYDNGYWMRYDLSPKKKELLFRFNNPYGDKLPELAIDEIRLEDPVSGQSTVINVGNPGDMDNKRGVFLAGTDWQMESTVDGHSVRRLVSVEPQPDVNKVNTKPNTYFYLELPSAWENNLRREWLKLTIRYKDEAPGYVTVEQRSIAPDEEFVAMRDGALLLTGSGEWREWSVPVRPQDLGWPVGMLYAKKHVSDLESLAIDTPELRGWVEKARGYLNTARIKMEPNTVLDAAEIVDGKKVAKLPDQCIIFPVFSADENGVILQHNIIEGDVGHPVRVGEGHYSPFIIAAQALGNVRPVYKIDYTSFFERNSAYSWIISAETAPYQVPPEAAYRWLRDSAVSVGRGVVWHMDGENAYNDLRQKAGWQSAFWQRYIIEAFMAVNDEDMVKKAAYAYGVPTNQGGLSSSWGGQRTLWFEEVPNNSHILNAHLASLVALRKVNDLYPDEEIKELEKSGLQALRENLYLYDTGYWTKYDMNPQKNILFALAWEGETDSPLLDEMYLYNPVENEAVLLNIGTKGDFEGASSCAGTLWRENESANGRTARKIAPQPLEDDWKQAAFLRISLPRFAPQDDFLLSEHYFVLRYKDTAKGTLHLFRQSIAEGNKLAMCPLPEAVVLCIGDGGWKTAVLRLPSQQLGWYMGPDYQSYHNEQLAIIAEQTGDWYFAQTCERWAHYLEAEKAAQGERMKTAS